MRQVAIFLTFAVASMAGKFLKSAIESLTWPALTGIALTMFSGFFIFTVMTAKSPVQFQWKPSIRIQQGTAEHLRNLVQLAGVLIIFAATVVCLLALADTGLDQTTGEYQTFSDSLMKILKCMPRMSDV